MKIISPYAITKIILLSFLSAFLTGCGTIQPRNRITSVMFLDFRPYVSADFHISPNSYTMPHNALGELIIIVHPAIKSNTSSSQETMGAKFSDGIYERGDSEVRKETITSNELLEIAVSKAMELGADGISNFETNVIYQTKVLKNGEIIQTISHYEIKGLCIDRL